MHRTITTSAALFLLLSSVTATAQLTDLRLPISLDADSTNYDGKNSMLMFRGLRLSQGNIGIEADEGARITIEIPDVGSWRFERTADGWTAQSSPPGQPLVVGGLRLTLDRRDATAVLSRGHAGEEVWERFRVSGDERLAATVRPLFAQILGRPAGGSSD